MNNYRPFIDSVAFTHHNHDRCLQRAMLRAETVCKKNRQKLTPQRREILSIIWREHKSVSAYQIIKELSHRHNRTIAPPTVYRVLNFLIENELIHKISSLNAYTGCSHPSESKQSRILFICSSCQRILEVPSRTINGAIQIVAKTNQFQVTSSILEFSGLCPACCANEHLGETKK